MREKSHSVTAPFFIFRKTLRTGLEFIRRLDARVVAELKAFRPVKGITLADPPGPEGVESLQEEVLRRDVARTDGEAPDPVQVAVRQAFRAVAAEEGAVLERLVIDEGIPRVRHVRIARADIKAHDPEGRRAAPLSAPEREIGRTRRMLIARVTVHIAPEVRTVLPVVHGEGRPVAETVPGADADNVGERVEGGNVISAAVSGQIIMPVVVNGAQVPGGDAEIRRKFVARLHVEGLPQRRDLILFEDGARRLDDIANDLAKSDARCSGAVFNSIIQRIFNCPPIKFCQT